MNKLERPFLTFWEELEILEMQRRKGIIPDDRIFITIRFIEMIGPDDFI